MRFLIGGRYQGQRELAAEFAGANAAEGSSCSREELYTAGAILDLHEAVRRFPDMDWEELFVKNPSLVISADEVGSGVIPADRAEREWREECGRIYCIAAAHSEEVYRMVSGLAVRIK